jgi:hypothetical protein
MRADARAAHLQPLYVSRLDRLTRSGIRDTLEVVRGEGLLLWARALEKLGRQGEAMQARRLVI